MGVRVRLAKEPEELSALMRLRYRVFVEEDGYLPPRDERMIHDFFDVLPTTSNLIALVDHEVVGGCRLTLNSAAGMPSDADFDFAPYLPEGARPAAGSLMCVTRSARMAPRLISGLLKMLFYRAHASRCTHLVALLNPRIRLMLERIGMRPVGEAFTDLKGRQSLPMVANLADLSHTFRQFLARQDLSLWLDTFERAFFEDGEPIVEEGAYGDEAYLVVGGRAAATAPDRDGQPQVLQRFEVGALFGELALLTDRPRSSTVRSVDNTDVMVVRRADFHRQLRQSPDLMARLLHSMGDRFYDAIQHGVLALRRPSPDGDVKP